MIRAAFVALAAALLAAAPAGAEPLRLQRQPAIAKGNDALPRIAAPATPQIAQVNAALARLDARWRAFLADCRKSRDSDASRSVTVTLPGPDFLAIEVRDDVSCGGAHPDEGGMGLTYDLATGRPVDWRRLLPGLIASTSLDTTLDGTRIGAFAAPRLHKLYLAQVMADADASFRSECGEVIGDPNLPMQAWPDAKKHGLVLEPFGLPHAVQACGDAAVISPAELRRLGADPRLITALEAARP